MLSKSNRRFVLWDVSVAGYYLFGSRTFVRSLVAEEGTSSGCDGEIATQLGKLASGVSTAVVVRHFGYSK